jgi:hypothetical protein
MCNKTINLKTNPIETYFNEKNPIKELKEIEEVEEDFHFIVSEDIQ